MVLNNNINLKNTLKKSLQSFLLIFFIIGVYFINGINSILSFKSNYGDSLSNEYFKVEFEELLKTVFGISGIALISGLLWCILFGLCLFIVHKLSKKILDKIENRLLRIFIYMIIMTIFTILTVLLINLVFKLMFMMLSALLKIKNTSSMFNLF